jgi:FHA domain
MFEDLGSRNGSRVNGRLVRQPHTLKDGDRIRIGTQELVFTEVEAVQLATNKQTGFLCHCANCRVPYPEEIGACPNCGSTKVEEESTLSGILDDRGRQNWALQMLIEMLKKAISLGRAADAERIMLQAMANVDERLRAPNPIDPSEMEALSLEAVKLSQLQKTSKWVRWIFESHRRAARLPSGAVAESISKLPIPELTPLASLLDDLVASAPVNKLSTTEIEGLDRLKSLREALGGN